MNDKTILNTSIIIGASGGIARAIIEQLLADPQCDRIIAVSRSLKPDTINHPKLDWSICDYSESAIDGWVESQRDRNDDIGLGLLQINRVIICHGILHSENIQPEKRLEDINLENLQHVFHVNTILPILWLKALRPLLTGNHPCHIAVLSARVGSIGDNQLGGWYSYRASKSALNMLLKTAAIEYARRAANVKIIAFHPGTTDTQLSKPFQKNVPAKKLFDTAFVADRLLDIMATQPVDGLLSYLDWDNQSIAW